MAVARVGGIVARLTPACPCVRRACAVMTVRNNMIEGGGRIDMHNRSDYSPAEAKDAYDRMLRVHGWA